MMPAIAKAMLAQHKFRTYYYGNFEGFCGQTRRPDKRRGKPSPISRASARTTLAFATD